MAKKVYKNTAIALALAIGLATAGTPAFLYFYYSNEIGAITITGKSWTGFCDATSWNDKNVCYAYINFTANEDVFWYPTDYDPYARGTPYSFDPAVKEWKLERKWGNGWREIPLTKPCTGTWCGAKLNIPALYSVAWRQGQSYETRIRAIKQNPKDNIHWSLGPLDPIWFGIQINELKTCKTTTIPKKQKLYSIYIYLKNRTFCYDFPTNKTCSQINYQNGTDRIVVGEYIELINTTSCESYGYNISGKIIDYRSQGYNCRQNGGFLECVPLNADGGRGCQGDTSGKPCTYININDFSIKTVGRQKGMKI